MLNRIIKFSVHNNVFVFLMTTIMAIMGWFAYQELPIDAVPDITNVQVQVNTPVEALTPDTIEKYITFPVENAMNAIPGSVEIRSITRFGLSQVTVIFEEGTDIYRARQLVSEKLQSLVLDENVRPQMGPISTGLGEIVHYTIEARSIERDPQKRLNQLMDLRTIQEWDIKPRLLTVRGVTEINTIGGYPRQYFVFPRTDLMALHGIHFEDIVSALKKNNFNTGGGFIQQTAEQLLVQGSGLYGSIADIRSVPVKMLRNFDTVTIGEIADIREERENRTGAALHRGEEAVIGTVIMLLGENSRSVSIHVADKLDEIRRTLPEWVELKTLYSRSSLVNETLDTVQKNLIFGALLVVIVLFMLAGNIRAALITAVTMPLSLLGTFILMKFFGISGSLMSMGALDFGIIIDGAVIVMDSCAQSVRDRTLDLGRPLNSDERKNAVIDATMRIRKAAGFGQLIIIIVFLPIFALAGIEGKMFRPMAATFCFAITVAFIMSFSTIPALAATFLTGRYSHDEPLLIRLMGRAYTPLLSLSLRFRRHLMAAALLLVAGSAILFSFMGGEFIPKLNEGSLAAQFIRPVNINTNQSVRLQSISEKIILEFSEVDTVFSRLGTAEITMDPAGINHGDTVITLKPQDQWPVVDDDKRTRDQLAEAISDRLQAAVPGQRILMSQPIELRFNELLEGIKSDIALKLFGNDMETLESKSREIGALLRTIPGAGDVETEIRGKSPLLKITPRMDVINRYGISKENILNTIRIAVGGENAGFLYDGVIRFPIIVRLPEEVRKNIDMIKGLPVGVSENFTVPLSTLASVTVEDIYSSIIRESSKRRTAIMINITGRDTRSFVGEAQEKVRQNITLPNGYYLEWGGNFKNLETAQQRLLVLAPAALILIFIMIYSAFNNLLHTLFIFSGIPFALVGGILNLKIMGLPFSISAGIGFIALSGIAVLNGIVLISFLNMYKSQGISGKELIINGSRQRLRPIMMTALTDIFGFLPMMIAAGTGSEVQKPLAVVIVGGIFTSTILTLLVIPALYYMYEDRMKESR